MKVKLREQSITVQAPKRLVFETLSSFADGGGSPAGVERARLLERNDDRLLMGFHSRDGRKMYRTLEEVVPYPHDRIAFRHLKDLLYHSQEQFDFTDISDTSGETRLTHTGEIECRMHRLPGAGWLVARFYVKRRYERLVLRHMYDLRERAEAAVGTSRN